MKRLIYMLISVFVLVGCSVTNRIIVTNHDKEGLKKIRLVQLPEVRVDGAENGLSGSSFKDASILYLFEENTAARPQITLEPGFSTDIKINKGNASMVMVLDNEDIPLHLYESVLDSLQANSDLSGKEKLKQKYVIPENLWLSIVHSHKTAYRVVLGKQVTLNFFLNQKEKDTLSEFLNMAIRQRDVRFPAVPEGQVKW